MMTQPPVVLVVEDSPTVATVVRHYLQLEGFSVLLAADGAQGHALARRERPDVVVTDLRMPGMDGATLLRALRSDPATAEMAVLVLSADAAAEGETRDAGADDYMVKPVDPRRLAVHVHALLERRVAS